MRNHPEGIQRMVSQGTGQVLHRQEAFSILSKHYRKADGVLPQIQTRREKQAGFGKKRRAFKHHHRKVDEAS